MHNALMPLRKSRRSSFRVQNSVRGSHRCTPRADTEAVICFNKEIRILRQKMHLQLTKRETRGSGGPQYYFHELSDVVKTYLRAKGAVRVALVTPYGATKSDYFAVSEDRKLDNNFQPVKGKVGHDRIQQGKAAQSIGESIRVWYNLPVGDFERIDVDIEVLDDVFYLAPLRYKYANRPAAKDIPLVERPLTFTQSYASSFWTQQLVYINKKHPGIVAWSLQEICRIVQEHIKKLAHIQEQDLLRASGPLKHLGITLGGYVGRGYDCVTQFSFLNFPAYSAPIEIKRSSRDFKYQQRKYGKEELSRAVVLCAVHDHKQVPKNIDIIELRALCEYSENFPVVP